MSGGSYEYLCHKSPEALVDATQDLERMAERLAGLAYAEDAARETEELLCIIRQFRVRAGVRVDRLGMIWKAVEWWDSGDWSEEDVKEQLAKYREEVRRCSS